MTGKFIIPAAFLVFAFCTPAISARDTTDDASDDMMQDFVESFRHPFIQVAVGNTAISLDKVSRFEDDLAFGADLGFVRDRVVSNSGKINHQTYKGLYLTYLKAPDQAPATSTAEVWRFGTRTMESYGYLFSEGKQAGIYFDAALSPLSWYSINGGGLVDTFSGARFSRFEDALRFGESTVASVTLRATDNISFTAGFEWAQAYERHMFWYWAGSQAIEGITDRLAEFFVTAIGKSSPSALPVMHFILRNGVAMGFKALRQNEMNWPFTTAAPLNFKTYQIGARIIF